jgi:hypothetical protein
MGITCKKKRITTRSAPSDQNSEAKDDSGLSRGRITQKPYLLNNSMPLRILRFLLFDNSYHLVIKCAIFDACIFTNSPCERALHDEQP